MAAHCEMVRRSWEPGAAIFASGYGGGSESAVLVLSNVDETSPHADEWAGTGFSPGMNESRSAEATRLRARAKRYRLLAESLFDPSIVAVVQACALELEIEAASIEKLQADRTGVRPSSNGQ